MNFKRQYWIPGLILVALMLFESSLRLGLGLGYPVLSMADPQTGYRFQPNQSLRRFGKTIEYNQYSQRSEAVTMPKPRDRFRILMVGDSVLNGGTPTDQTETISELLETQLSVARPQSEVLNASAGSWGIGNQLGYLREFGFFESDILILQIGTHDLTQPMSTSDRVGNDPNYPHRRPLLATQELFARYLVPQLQRRLPQSSPEIPVSEDLEGQFQQNMVYLNSIVTLARRQSISVYILYTPNWTDVLPQPSNPPYKADFLAVLDRLNVPLIDVHAAWSQLPAAEVESYFRDSVHLTVTGHQAVANLVQSQLL